MKGKTGFAAALVVVAALAAPSVGSGHTKILKLSAADTWRGYSVQIRAMKQDQDEPENPEPVRISVILRNGVQTHRYEFDAPRRHLIFRGTLASGRLKLASLSGPATSVVARVGHGEGTIRFAATGAARERACSGGRSTLSRPQARTGGHLEFSPTTKDEHEFVRREWSGIAKVLRFGGCAQLPPCPRARRLSAFETDGAQFGIVVWRLNAGGPLRIESNLLELDPPGPSVFTIHTRVAQAARSRFEVTRLAHGSVDLDGVPGFSGSFEVTGESAPIRHYAPCAGKLREGSATGTAGARFAFAPDQSTSAWDGGMIARGRL